MSLSSRARADTPGSAAVVRAQAGGQDAHRLAPAEHENVEGFGGHAPTVPAGASGGYALRLRAPAAGGCRTHEGDATAHREADQ
jgi:hypothetical protein